MARRRTQWLGVLAIFAVLGGGLGLTLIAERVFGAEVGEPCTQGTFFPCRSERFNSGRCLYDEPGPDAAGYCTRLCEDPEDVCPEGWRCELGSWGQSSTSRVERVCVRPR
ncbi:MAG: hypothetical protein AB7S26_04100 [Sandaracinaceae bacterium]